MGAFTPRRIAALEPRVREIAKRSLDAIDPRGPVDFVEQIAIPLPMYVIAELLGVSPDDYDDFRRWSDAMIEAGGGEPRPRRPTAIGGRAVPVRAATSPSSAAARRRTT